MVEARKEVVGKIWGGEDNQTEAGKKVLLEAKWKLGEKGTLLGAEETDRVGERTFQGLSTLR